jgi:hypothetical protein
MGGAVAFPRMVYGANIGALDKAVQDAFDGTRVRDGGARVFYRLYYDVGKYGNLLLHVTRDDSLDYHNRG